MTRFDADKGLIHFTFANEDTYVKKSLVTLNRQQNLYYELKAQRYRTVFFVDLMNSHYLITCGDGAAAQQYERYKEKSGPKGLWGRFNDQSREGEDGSKITVHKIPREQKENLLKVFDRMMSGSSQTAFVCSIEAMASFQGISAAERILKKQIAENYLRNNLLLIVSDTHLDASFDKLTNPDGIFQTEAFPEIRRICQDYSNVRLYEHMEQQMPGRISYMNDMEREEIYNLVTLTILENRGNVKARLNRREDYTDFLWLMVHSVKFSNQVKKKAPGLSDIFPVNNKRLFSLLRDTLRENAAYENMDALIDDFRAHDKTEASLLSLINADDAAAEYQQYLYQSNAVLEKVGTIIPMKEDCEKAESFRNKICGIEEKLYQIRRELVKPHVISDENNHQILQDFIRTCLDTVLETNNMHDYDTMTIAVDALHYAICKCEQESMNSFSSGSDADEKQYEDQAVCIRYYKYALELQKSVAAQTRKRSIYLESLFRLNREQNRRQEQIQAIEREYDGIAKKAMKADNNSPIIDDYRFKIRDYADNQKSQESTAALLKNVSANLTEQSRTIAALLYEISCITDNVIAIQNLPLSTNRVSDLMDKAEQMKKYNDSFYQELSRLNKPDMDLDDENLVEHEDFHPSDEIDMLNELFKD